MKVEHWNSERNGVLTEHSAEDIGNEPVIGLASVRVR
jgi:hypothetical protein